MAPVPFRHPVRYTPLALAGTHLALIVYLTYAVGASLYTSYKSLGPAQDTRSRLAQRKRFAPVFLALAAAAFSLATCSSIVYTRLSYITWAYEHGLDLPGHLVGDDGYIPDTRDSSQLYVAQWLSDTPVFEALEIVAEKARRFWWGQQIDLATTAFSMLLAIEGRRRKIPMLSAFVALAQLVNLSFAQNLFYLALLLTPSPLPAGDGDLQLPVVPFPPSQWAHLRDRLLPPKPGNWFPHPSIFACALALNLAFIFFIPYAAGTSSFTTAVLLTRLSTFLPLILPKIVPGKWGTVYQHPHDAYHSFVNLFRFLSVAAFALHAKVTFTGLVFNAPYSHYHRHSALFPWDVEERSKWERSTTALGKLLGSTSDHPVVAAVGWDVLICTLSLGVWAAVRATNVNDIFHSVIPFYSPTTSQAIESTPQMKEQTPQSPSIKEELETSDDIEHEHHMTLRRRDRSGKVRGSSIVSSSGVSEAVVPPSTRKRGRPKKTKQVKEEEMAYEPSPAEARQLVEGDVLPPQELDWDSAALAWGLFAFSGLASASAGVFGGECVAR
ncbi:hypothetical protein F5X99DRAFT_383195 [Biscogniauxia marginata]|nr:hypothetical protein F5X99DRAFT_383195 [Biscogniauxia marginata]